MPHSRPICFWAKASMFKNPIAGWVFTSSGAIPVRRNPNNVAPETAGSNDSGPPDEKAADMRMELFRETFQALDSGEVIGLFPEGTSYTEPQIAQIKDGVSWVALEYARWQKEQKSANKGAQLLVVPVGIVYTNKSKYQSRVSLPYASMDLLLKIHIGICAIWGANRHRNVYESPFVRSGR
jgi:glycerol-3-phosphate O-acyltransferase / dihydroxyacetone phosphate acyltransferase